jgi:16S rRNA (cytidine1402-2'-O)-methyltransferase
LIDVNLPVIYYDSPYRVIKNLKLLQEISQEKEIPKRMVLGRELTKIHEQIKRGAVEDIIQYFENHPDKLRGEFVLIIY